MTADHRHEMYRFFFGVRVASGGRYDEFHSKCINFVSLRFDLLLH